MKILRSAGVVLQYKTPIGAIFTLHVLILFFLFIIFLLFTIYCFLFIFFISDGCASESYVGSHFSFSKFPSNFDGNFWTISHYYNNISS